MTVGIAVPEIELIGEGHAHHGDTTLITFTGLHSSNPAAVDGDGIYWLWTELVGWFTNNITYEAAAPAAGIGTVPLQVRRGDKPLTLRGFAGVVDIYDWWAAANVLEAALDSISDIDNPGTLLVREPTGDVSVDVYLAGPWQLSHRGIALPDPKRLEIQTGFQFLIPLIAPDPTKDLGGS